MISKKIADKLQDQEYRTAFVASQINVGIPFQIKALMKARGWTQEQLAERTGMLQPRISAMLKPGKVRPNIETLRRFAEAFDCGLMVRFAPYSELARWSEDFDPESFSVPSFNNDVGFVEHKSQGAASTGFSREAQPLLESAQDKGNLIEMPQRPPQTTIRQPHHEFAGCAGAVG
jgi:transcriptional regulator with XRE-family HTH domain